MGTVSVSMPRGRGPVELVYDSRFGFLESPPQTVEVLTMNRMTSRPPHHPIAALGNHRPTCHLDALLAIAAANSKGHCNKCGIVAVVSFRPGCTRRWPQHTRTTFQGVCIIAIQ